MLKDNKIDFIIHEFAVSCLGRLRNKWYIIQGNNENDVDNGRYLAKNGDFRGYGIYNIYKEDCQFNSRREAIGFLKSKFKNVNIVREIEPFDYYDDDDDYDEDVDWDDDEDDYDDDF